MYIAKHTIHVSQLMMNKNASLFIVKFTGIFIGIMIILLPSIFAQNGEWTNYNTGNSNLPNDIVRCFAFDTKGNSWIGTKGGGVAMFDGTDWTVYTKSNSALPDSEITSLAVDQQDNIWG